MLLRALILVACSVSASATALAQDLLIGRAAFRTCEGEAFISLLIARNGMHLSDTRASLLAVPSNREFQITVINELFDEMERTGSKDHGGFAARKFYQCAKREGLTLTENVAGAAVCLARQDIVFFVSLDRNKNVPQPEALARIKRYLGNSSKAVYPDALIEQLVPMVYRVASTDDDYLLRQLVFETCLFPNEWKAWYEATRTPGK